MTESVAAELVAFWTGAGALDEAGARERLAHVVCVLRDRAGAVAGVNSVDRADLQAIGGRPFWVHRSFLPGLGEEVWAAMGAHAFLALQAEYRRTEDGPIGVAFLVDDPERLARHPEADWLWPPAFYAGWTQEGHQLRIAYFYGAGVGPPKPLADFGTALDQGYRIEPFAEQDAIDATAVVDLWSREGALAREEAERRADEVLLVATHGSDLAGVATAYIEHNAQLATELWYVRTYVAEAHRFSHVSWTLLLVARDHLQCRFVGGVDTRARGAAIEVENRGVRHRFDEVIWLPLGFAYIGDNARGDHVRVRWFPGALTPSPP